MTTSSCSGKRLHGAQSAGASIVHKIQMAKVFGSYAGISGRKFKRFDGLAQLNCFPEQCQADGPLLAGDGMGGMDTAGKGFEEALLKRSGCHGTAACQVKHRSNTGQTQDRQATGCGIVVECSKGVTSILHEQTARSSPSQTQALVIT